MFTQNRRQSLHRSRQIRSTPARWMGRAVLATVLAFVGAASALADIAQTFPWVRGYDVSVPRARGPLPPVNSPFVDDVYGTTIRRISKDATSWRRHEYSRRPAFNADSSRIILRSSGGFWHAYRIVSDQVRYEQALPAPMIEPNWHPTDPDRYRYFEDNGAGMNILEYNITTRRSQVIANFTDRLPWPNATRVWTRWEGRPSDNGRIWCLMAQTEDFKTLGLFSYDLARDRIIGTMDVRGEPDHVSTSVNGRYCVPSGEDVDGGTRAYSLDFSRFTQLHEGGEHSDVALDENGHDVLVLADYSSGWIRMADMATGRSTRLIPLYQPRGSTFSVHISGLATDVPGHVVVSTYNAHLDYGNIEARYGDMWGHDRLAVVELKSNPQIYNIAYMRNGRGDYWSEPQAATNRDLSRIVFASTWGSNADDDSRSYMVTMPKDRITAPALKRRLLARLDKLRGQLSRLPVRMVSSRADRNSLIVSAWAVTSAVKGSDWARGNARIRSFRGRVNGCGSMADRSDYVTHCARQRQIRRQLTLIATDYDRLRRRQ